MYLTLDEFVSTVHFSKDTPMPTNVDDLFIACKKYADMNNPIAIFNLGILYNKGIGVLRNRDKAIELFERSAELDDVCGLFCLALIDRTSGEDGLYKAMSKYLKAAKLGDSYSAIEIGNFYEYGILISKNYVSALEWYNSATKNGNTFGMLHEANMHLFGIGIEVNKQKAYDLHVLGEKLGGYEISLSFGKKIMDGYFTEFLGDTNKDMKVFNLFKYCIDNKQFAAITWLGKLYRSTNDNDVKIGILDILVRLQSLRLDAKTELVKLFGQISASVFINSWKNQLNNDGKINLINTYPAIPDMFNLDYKTYNLNKIA